MTLNYIQIMAHSCYSILLLSFAMFQDYWWAVLVQGHQFLMLVKGLEWNLMRNR